MKFKLNALIIIYTALFLLSPAAGQTETDKQVRREAMKKSKQFLAEAIDAYDAARLDNASAFLDSARYYDPENPDIIYYNSLVLTAKNDTSAAMANLREGSEKAPLSRRIKILLARLEIAHNNYTEASAIIDRVLAINPREGEALYLKGLILLAEGDSTGAAVILKEALEIAMDKK